MSKISDHQKALATLEKELANKGETVAEFAKTLGKEPAALMAQFRSARLSKQGESDLVTPEDKELLLRYLQESHGAPQRKKITVTVQHPHQKLLEQVAAQENGAEWEALENLMTLVVSGGSIDPALQTVINLIVAKTVLTGLLPYQKRGRPKSEDEDHLGISIANDYWRMRDSGVGYQAAVERLAERFHKDERHLMRIVAKHKADVGSTLDERERKRSWHRLMHEIHLSDPERANLFFDLYRFNPALPPPELTLDDYLEHLEEMTRQAVSSIKPLTQNI